MSTPHPHAVKNRLINMLRIMGNSSNLSSSHSVESFVTKMSQSDFQNETENIVRSVTVDEKTLTGQEMIDFLVK